MELADECIPINDKKAIIFPLPRWRANVSLVYQIVHICAMIVFIITLCVAIAGGVSLFGQITSTLTELRVLIADAIAFFKSEGIIH